ncbi:hypothetical protein SUGI_0147400 [Cryptomeria japonica]|nr:hypothetical protein SUGI_0147400 [Cryptomeria japonica]
MAGVKDYLRAKNTQSIRDELVKWGPHVEIVSPTAEASPSKHKRRRPVGSTKMKLVHSLQISESSSHRDAPETIEPMVAQKEIVDIRGKAVREAS